MPNGFLENTSAYILVLMGSAILLYMGRLVHVYIQSNKKNRKQKALLWLSIWLHFFKFLTTAAIDINAGAFGISDFRTNQVLSFLKSPILGFPITAFLLYTIPVECYRAMRKHKYPRAK